MGLISRRTFNARLGKGVGGAVLMGNIPLASALYASKPQDKSLGIALVGLGSYSTYQLAPSLRETQYCHLAGIVTGTPSKAHTWSQQYAIPDENIYNYDNFDTIAGNKSIDVVYVVLPNSMHAEFAIKAAKAGKHVICEKPMAVNVAECDAIISACAKAGVELAVGYRLHSEPYTQEIKRIVAERKFGEVNYVAADAAYVSRGNPEQWRLNKELSGGGALMNMGVYSIQSTIYGTGKNPISVRAQEFSTRPEYFKQTDETITAQLEFPGGVVADIMTSHNANANRLYGSCENGWYELQPANNYGPLHGRTSEGELAFPHERQQKLQMDDFAKHILLGTRNVAPGEMGKRDMIIVEAVYRSIAEGSSKIALDLGNMGLV